MILHGRSSEIARVVTVQQAQISYHTESVTHLVHLPACVLTMQVVVAAEVKSCMPSNRAGWTRLRRSSPG